MKWGYQPGAKGKPFVPIELDITSYCHALLTGASGSGKSYALMFLVGCLLKEEKDIVLYFCDFKNSEDFNFLEGYPHFYSGDQCLQGVQDFYQSFCDSRKNRTSKQRHILIFDEYPAFLNYISGLDKQNKTKYANDVLNAIAEILMLGRGLNYGVWIVTQRADASLFANGARDNFMVVIGLGRMSKEQKGMIFAGEEIPDRIYGKGEGLILADGYGIKEIKYPKINNLPDWKMHIRLILLRNRN